MQPYVTNVINNQGFDIAATLQKMVDSQLISEEELIAIALEYNDEPMEDWKVHLNKIDASVN